MKEMVSLNQPTLSSIVTNNIKAEMARRGLTQKHIASWLETTQGAVSCRLRCEREWKLDEIETIAQYFAIPVINLFDDTFYRVDMKNKKNNAENLRPRQDSNLQPKD